MGREKDEDRKTLSEDKIKTLKEAFNLTVTSYGLQPVKLVVLQNKEIQKSLVKHSWNQPQVEQATHVLVFCIPKEYTIKEVEDYFDLVKKIRNTPDEILNPFKGFLTEDIAKGVKNSDAIYTDVWVSMGEATEKWQERINLLKPYQVNTQLIALGEYLGRKGVVILGSLDIVFGEIDR